MSQRIRIAERNLNVVQCGAGTPLLLVHGFPLDHQMWLGQIQELAEEFHLVAPDLRGFGGSDCAGETVRMEQYADDLAELLDALQLSQPVVLCGLSMGGYVAWQFWRRHRHRLSHLILCDTRAVADSPEIAAARLETAEQVLRHGPSLLVDTMIPKLFSSQTRRLKRSLVADTMRVIEQARPEGLAAALRGMAGRVDATPWLPEIDVPTLVICGQQDVISPVAEMQGLAQALPRSRFAVIPGSGHLAPLEAPTLVNHTIRAFLAAPPHA
jgi:pimeloyl-ACP methyl ester carboxylesterase